MGGNYDEHRVRILQKLESWRDELKKHDNIKQVLPATLPPLPPRKERKPTV